MTKYGTPSNVVKQGIGVFSVSQTLLNACEYYRSCRLSGYSVQHSIEGATQGALFYSILDSGGEKLVVYSAELAALGLYELETVVGAEAGVVTLGVAGAGALIGSTVASNADKVGSDIALTHCYFASRGGFFKTVGGAIKGFFSKSPGTNQVQFTPISALTSTQINEHKESIRNSKNLTPTQKINILKDIDDQVEVKSYLQDVLGYNYAQYSQVNPKGLSLLARPEDAFDHVSPSEGIISVGTQENPKFAYALGKYGLNITQGSANWNNAQSRLAQKGGILNANGLFDSQAAWKNVAITSDGKLYEIVSTDTLASIDDQLKAIFKLNKEQDKKLDEILKNTTVTLPDGSQIGVGEAVGKLISFNVAKELKELSQQERERRYKNDIAYAHIVGAVGGLIGNSDIVKFGASLELIINMGYALPGVLAGDPVSIATFLTSTLSLVGLFRKKKTIDPNQMIMKCLQSISAQIEELKNIVIQGNLQILAAIDRLMSEMLEGFQNVYLEIYINRLLSSQKLDRLQQSMHQLSIQVNRQINGLWLNDLMEARFNILNYRSRYGSLANLPVNADINEELERTANTLVNWCRNKSGHLNSRGGHLYYYGCPSDKVLSVLMSADPEDIIGFLLLYMNNTFLCASAKLDGAVANPNVWLLAATTFMEVMTEVDGGRFYRRYDPQHNVYKELLLSGARLLEAFERIRGNSDIFILLLAKYKSIIDGSLKPAFLKLLNDKNNDAQSKKASKAILDEKEKVTMRTNIFNVHCAVDLPVSKNEPNAGQVHAVLNHWNSVIAKDVVPKFFAEYQGALYKELSDQRSLELPLSIFYVASNDSLLPLSIIFSSSDTRPTPFKLPKVLLDAEKLGIGNFVFEISGINPITEGPAQNDPNNFALNAFDIIVKITFKYLDNSIDVATVTLHLNPADHHSAVNAIRSAATINSIYGKETGNPFYGNARNVLAKVALISAWMNAKVTNYQLTLDSRSQTALAIQTEIQQRQVIDIVDISRDLESGTPRTNIGGEAYARTFIKFQELLTDLDVCYHLLLSFSRLGGLSDEITSKLSLLWRSKYVVQVIMHLAKSPLQAVDPAQQNTQSLLTSFQTFDQIADTHLSTYDDHTSESPHASLPSGSVSYIEVCDEINTELLLSSSNPYVTFNPVQIAILSHLRSLVRRDVLASLNINISNDWFDENLPWYRGNLNIQLAPQANLVPKPYSIDDVEKLLVNQFDDPIRYQRVLPTYSPNPNLPLLLQKQFEKSLEVLLRKHINTGLRILVPIQLNYNEANRYSGWMVILAVYDARQKTAVVLFVDPRGNENVDQSSIIVDTASPYQNADVLKQSLVTSVIKSFEQAEVTLQRLIVTGIRQIASDNAHQSGPITVLNVQRFMNQIAFDTSPLLSIDQIRQTQHQSLELIREQNPSLCATPVDINLASIELPAIVANPPNAAPIVCAAPVLAKQPALKPATGAGIFAKQAVVAKLAAKQPALKPAAGAGIFAKQAVVSKLAAKPPAKPVAKQNPDEGRAVRPI